MEPSPKSRILIIVDSLDENTTSGARANAAMVRNMASAFNLEVIHSSNKELTISDLTLIAVKEHRYNWRFILSRSVRLIRRHLKIELSRSFENIIGFSFTFLNLAFSFEKKINQIALDQYKLVITLSEGESFLPHYVFIKYPKHHLKWLAYIHDPYPMACYPKSYAFEGPGTAQKRDFMQAVFHSARFIGFPSLLLSEWMKKYYSIENQKIRIIPHQLGYNSKQNSYNKSSTLFDKTDFNILFAGNLLGQRNPIGLIQAVNQLVKDHPELQNKIKLYLIGPVSPTHRSQFNSLDLTHVVMLKSMSFIDAINHQNRAAVNVILESEDESSPFLPGKFPHCIAADKPILLLGPEISEARRLLGKDYPYFAQPNDFESIVICLEQLLQDWLLKKPFKYEDKLYDYLSAPELNETISSLIAND